MVCHYYYHCRTFRKCLSKAIDLTLTRENRNRFIDIENKLTVTKVRRGIIGNLELKYTHGVPVVAQWLTNPTRNHEVAGLVPALAQWVNDMVLP